MAPRAPARPAKQANKEKSKTQASGISKAKAERKPAKVTKREAQSQSTTSTSPNTEPADARLVSRGRSLWSGLSREDLNRMIHEAMENVKLPDGEFDLPWYFGEQTTPTWRVNTLT